MSEPASDALHEKWRPDQVAAMESLREWSVIYAELNHHMARWAGLPTSDGNALGQVVWAVESSEPLSPAQLSRRIGLTSGATTVLVDRLERAGLLTRSRDHADRRRVTLRPTDDGRERVRRFTEFAGVEIADALQTMPAADLDHATNFITQMTSAAAAANSRLSHRNSSNAESS